MQSYLKVKIKSLAAEAAIIRHEERRLIGRKVRPHLFGSNPESKERQGGQIKWLRDHQAEPIKLDRAYDEYNSLRLHRIKDVRGECRSANLAYAFLRGKTYSSTEKPGSKPVFYSRVAEIAMKYGPRNLIGPSKDIANTLIQEWIKGGQQAHTKLASSRFHGPG